MDSNQYLKDSERTEVKLEGQDLKPEFTIRLPQMLNYSRVVGKFFDDFKRQLYYGVEVDPETMGFPPANGEGNYNLALTKEKIALLHAALGIMTESCELVEQILSHIYENNTLDTVNVGEEIGDSFWYFAILCRHCGFTFEDLMDKNINKLQVRFPDKFSQEKAIERDLDAEHKVLEGEPQ